MDATVDMVPGTSTTAVNIGEASTATAGTSGEESKCRKSSRLREKTTRQAQGAGSDGAGDAYNLRLSSLVKRVQVERRQAAPKQPKGKSKPPPLSKYRRRTANARERMRMKDMNDGFEKLRDSLPDMDQQDSQGNKKEKPTKLTVLNLALNYIHALRDILGYSPMDESGSSGSSSSSSATTISGSEESELGSDVTSASTLSVSSVSCDETCSSYPSPQSSSADPKDFCLAEPPMVAAGIPDKGFVSCHDPLTSSSVMMDFRREARFSPSSSDLSLSPSPPPLPLPEECMELDHSDLLDVSMSLAALDGIDDIVL